MQEGHCLCACSVRSKRLIQNVLPRLVVKCSNLHLKGQKNTPQRVKISPLIGWPYCVEVTDEEEEVEEEEKKGCITIKCCLLHIIGRLMDWAWLFTSDPITLFEKITKKLFGAFESQIKFLFAILGVALVFIGMSIIVYAATKLAELCKQTIVNCV